MQADETQDWLFVTAFIRSTHRHIMAYKQPKPKWLKSTALTAIARFCLGQEFLIAAQQCCKQEYALHGLWECGNWKRIAVILSTCKEMDM